MRMGASMLTRCSVACSVALFRRFRRVGFGLVACALLWAQHSPPPGPPRPGSGNRPADIRRKLDSTKAVDVTAERALQYARAYLDSAVKISRSGETFQADRLTEAADALLHIAEHQQHLRTGGGPKGPPPAEEIQDHLQRVYFGTQQADYFLTQSHDSRAAAFPKWARDFYQLALAAYDRQDLIAADENAKCAEEVVKALENLAQAAASVDNPSLAPKPPVPARRRP